MTDDFDITEYFGVAKPREPQKPRYTEYTKYVEICRKFLAACKDQIKEDFVFLQR